MLRGSSWLGLPTAALLYARLFGHLHSSWMNENNNIVTLEVSGGHFKSLSVIVPLSMLIVSCLSVCRGVKCAYLKQYWTIYMCTVAGVFSVELYPYRRAAESTEKLNSVPLKATAVAFHSMHGYCWTPLLLLLLMLLHSSGTRVSGSLNNSTDKNLIHKNRNEGKNVSFNSDRKAIFDHTLFLIFIISHHNLLLLLRLFADSLLLYVGSISAASYLFSH